MHKLLCLIFLSYCLVNGLFAQSISIEETTYAERPHYVIKTPAAAYFYDRAGGGFSRILDSYGNDWIGFQPDSSSYPAAAATSYRGLPNLVFQGDNDGAGHPGFDQCESAKTDSISILTTSRDGKWQWRWTFFATYAQLDIEKIDIERNYWFLYEGLPGGTFEPKRQYWATNSTGLRTDQPDYYRGKAESGYWQWAYFGKEGVGRVFFVAQKTPDRAKDIFGYLGNTEKGVASGDGMVVFGFGRNPETEPLLNEPQTFYIGFINGSVSSSQEHQRVAKEMQQLLLQR